MKKFNVLAVFDQYDYGDENGPCGYRICVETKEGKEHFHLYDGSRFSEPVTLSHVGGCDGSCRRIPDEVASALQKMIESADRGTVTISP